MRPMVTDSNNIPSGVSDDGTFGSEGDDGGSAASASEATATGTTSTNDWYDTNTAVLTETETASNPPSTETENMPSTFVSQPTSSITSSSSNNTQSDNDNDGGGGGGMSNNTKIAIAVPVAIVGAAIIAAILFFLLRRRRRQRNLNSQPVIATPQMDNSSSIFLPQQQPEIQPVPLPVAAPITRRPVPQGPYIEPVEPASAETGNVVAAGATRDLEWRTSEERGGRPRSPFDHPHDNDDNLSIVSGISDREAMMRTRAPRDDDMSSVSSFEDEPRPSTTNRGS